MTADKELLEALDEWCDQLKRCIGATPSHSKYIATLTAAIQRIEQGEAPLSATAATDCVPCRHEWYQGACAHCEMPASEYRRLLAAAPAPAPEHRTYSPGSEVPGHYYAAPAQAEPVAMLREVREFLADEQHGHWPYVENGQQAEDLGGWVQKLDAFLAAPAAPVDSQGNAVPVEAGTMAHVLSKETIEEWRVCLTSGKDVRYDRDAIEGTALCAMAENWRRVEEHYARSRMKGGER